MPFTYDAAAYEELLDKLRENRDMWDTARTFAECQQVMSGISGIDAEKFAAMVGELRSYHADDQERMLEQLRLTALAWPASDYGLTGAEWQGYFVAELADKQQFHAADRFAEPSQWAKVEVAAEALALNFDEDTGLLYDEDNWYLPDGHTIVTLDSADPARSADAEGNVYVLGVLREGPDAAGPADSREPHFDAEVQRWRRWSDDGGEFEHYHNEDGVWERRRGTDDAGRTIWHRHHSAGYGWLRYDSKSDRWLDPKANEWRPHAEVGIPAAPVAPAEEPARPESAVSAEVDAGLEVPADDQDLRLEDLAPELQEFLQRLYEMDPDHRKVPIRTVLEILVETEDGS
ncbi:MAG TPA: hypothetical protein VFQ44_20910 [Streptosporangiaceae bacterium]|nr:hypothetical protein [Streptosporangiaceae bacterium]